MKRLLVALSLSLITTLIAVSCYESYWRSHNYQPSIIDSDDLWATQRSQVYRHDKIPLALLGASRTLYAIDRDVFRQRLPGYEPIMLAINGKTPVATLRDLAKDKNFKGFVICDIDGQGLGKNTWEMQQPEVDNFHKNWTPSRALHRRLLNLWQARMVIARTDFSLLRAAVRWWNDESEPWHPHFWVSRHRDGFLDFTLTDPTTPRRALEANLATWKDKIPGAGQREDWLRNLQEIRSWVNLIQARGGEVIFYSPPISGLHREMEERIYPRTQYWDELAPRTGAISLHADDEPALRNFPLPDETHIDYREKTRYTQLLVDALVRRELIPPNPLP